MPETLEEALALLDEVPEEDLFKISNDLRTISGPSDFILGVYNDKNVRTLYFRMPKEYEGIDLSTYKVNINCQSATGETTRYYATDAEVSGDYIYFSWLTDRPVYESAGTVRFNVCLTKADSEAYLTNEFNTTPYSLTVLQGLEGDEEDQQPQLSFREYIEKILAETESATETANQVNESSKSYAEAAKTSEDNAKTSEAAAANSASAASSTVTQGKTDISSIIDTAKTDINKSITDAKSTMDTDLATAKGYSDSASSSANAASNSATNAATSESNAKTYAENAKSSADAAASEVGILTPLVNILYNKSAASMNTRYEEKSLGAFTTAMSTAIQSGDFSQFSCGNTITFGSETLRIMGANVDKNKGDTQQGNSLTMMWDSNRLAADGSTTKYMNDSDTTSGGYVGSKMYTTTLPNLLSALSSDLTSHIYSHRELLCNAVSSGVPSGWAWYSVSIIIPTEEQIYGTKVFGSGGQNVGISYTQFPALAMCPERITNRSNYWLRNIVSASTFARCGSYGVANASSASDTWLGVRPYVLVH